MRARTSALASLRAYIGAPPRASRQTRPMPCCVLRDGATGSGHASASSSSSISARLRFASMYARGNRASIRVAPSAGAALHSRATCVSSACRTTSRGGAWSKSSGYHSPECGESSTSATGAPGGSWRTYAALVGSPRTALRAAPPRGRSPWGGPAALVGSPRTALRAAPPRGRSPWGGPAAFMARRRCRSGNRRTGARARSPRAAAPPRGTGPSHAGSADGSGSRAAGRAATEFRP